MRKWILHLIVVVYQQAIPQDATHLPPGMEVHNKGSGRHHRTMMKQNAAEVAGICLAMLAPSSSTMVPSGKLT